MIINYKNTKIDYSIKVSDDSFGLGNNDVWCFVDFKVSNDEFNYDVCRKSITKHEIIHIINKLKSLLNGEIIKKEKIVFIKNYFIFNLYVEDNNKILKIDLISLKDVGKKDRYSLYLINDEIEDFYKMALNCNEIKKYIND